MSVPSRRSTRRLILCADDFGYSRAISETIVALARAEKLNATTCMAGMPGWRTDAALLRNLPPHFQIGLHLTLTGECPITAMPQFAPGGTMPSIGKLHRMTGERAAPLAEIEAEIAAQFDAFADAMGRPPDFVDGHQHVHALPGIRGRVLAETARRNPRAWVRDCTDRWTAMLARPFRGKALASAWHSHGLRAAAAAHGLACNDGFAGHYDFGGDFGRIFPKFLRRAGACHLVMCHPGAGLLAGDTIAAARLDEAAAFDALPVAPLARARGLAFPS